MATILAANTGNWSATGTWTGGVIPVAGDIVVANGKTVTMDTLNVTVAELRNDTTGGATAGGTFNLVNGSNITANIYAGSTTTSCVTWTGLVGQTATLTGNFFGGTGNPSPAINCTAGNLVIGGGSQVTGPSGSAPNNNGAVQMSASAGNFTFCTAQSPGVIQTGNTTGGSCFGVSISSTNSINTIYASSISGATSGLGGSGLYINGTNIALSVTAGTIGDATRIGAGINLNGTFSSCNIISSGNISGASNALPGVYVQTNSNVSITCGGTMVPGSTNNAAGSGVVLANVISTTNITGNAIGSNVVTNGAYGIWNNGPGSVNLIGSATAGITSSAMVNSSTGICRCTRAIGNGYGVGSVGISSVVAVSATQNSLTYVEQLQLGSLGAFPVSGPIRLTANTGNSMQFTTTTGTTKTLVDTAATSGVLPAATDVRSGVVYSSGNVTGTCAIPSANSVAYGVPVDNTTGNAVLTPTNVRDAVGLASANLDTQLTNVNNTAIATSLMG